MALDGAVVDPARWMQQLQAQHPIGIEALALCDLALIGAHNAGSHRITKDCAYSGEPHSGDYRDRHPLVQKAVLRGVVSRWARCQSRSVLELATLGIRYFDVRLCSRYNGGDSAKQWLRPPTQPSAKPELWTCHALYSQPLRDVVADLLAFCSLEPHATAVAATDATAPSATSPHEVVVLDVQHLYGETADTAFHGAFIECLAPVRHLLAPRPLGVATPLREFWAPSRHAPAPATESGPRARPAIVVLYAHAPTVAQCSFLHPRDSTSIVSRQSVESVQVGELVHSVAAEQSRRNADVAPGARNTVLHVNQGQGTGSGASGFLSVASPLSSHVKGLDELAARTNGPVLAAWDGAAPRGTSVDARSVLLLDFSEQGTLNGLSPFGVAHRLNLLRLASTGASPRSSFPSSSFAPALLGLSLTAPLPCRLRSYHGSRLRVHPGSEGAKVDLQAAAAGPWERVELVPTVQSSHHGERKGNAGEAAATGRGGGDPVVHVRSAAHGTYLRCHPPSGTEAARKANVDTQRVAAEWEAFRVVPLSRGPPLVVALESVAHAGIYLSARGLPTGSPVSGVPRRAEWEAWVVEHDDATSPVVLSPASPS